MNMQLLIHSYLALSVILVLASVACVLLDLLFERRAREKEQGGSSHLAETEGSPRKKRGGDRAD